MKADVLAHYERVLKRINFEDDLNLKHRMISVLEKLMEKEGPVSLTLDFTADGTKVNIPVSPESINKDVVHSIKEFREKTVEALPLAEEIVLPDVSVPVEDVVTEDPSAKQEETHAPVAVITVPEEEQVSLDLGDIEEAKAVEPVVTEEIADATVPEAAPIVVPAEPIFVEKFGLMSPTKEEHLNAVMETEGVLFLNKKTFMLGLSLKDEILAFAKTTKINNFPEKVQQHLKNNGFATVDVTAVGEVEQKSKQRLVDITFKNFTLLPADHYISVNVTNFLETGEVPKGKEEVKEDGTPVVEENFISQTFMINPQLVDFLHQNKEAALQQNYSIVTEGTLSKLNANRPDGSILLIGINDKSTIKEGVIKVQILDYVFEQKEDKRTYGAFKLSFAQEETVVTEEDAEAMQEESDPQRTVELARIEGEEQAYEEELEEAERSKIVAITERDMSVNLQANGEVPADFPSKNHIILELYPYAEKMFTIEKVEEMIGHPLDLGILNNANGKSHIGLMYDEFEMAFTPNTLTEGTMRDSKWIAKVTKIDLIPDDVKRKFSLHVEFDYLVEYPHFTFENPSAPLDIRKFRAITEEGYLAKIGGSVPKEEPQPVAEVKPVEKEYDSNAGQLLEPRSGGNFGGTGESVGRAPMTTASAQAVMERANVALSGAIDKTQVETSIHMAPENNQTATTQVMGNIQPGAGVMTQTTTIVPFVTGWEPETWYKSVGRRIQMTNEFHHKDGALMGKAVQIMGKNDGAAVAQAVVPMSEALFMDGSHHQAVILGVKKVEPFAEGKRFVIHLELGEFQKIA